MDILRSLCPKHCQFQNTTAVKVQRIISRGFSNAQAKHRLYIIYQQNVLIISLS